MRTITVNVSDPVYRELAAYAKKTGRPTAEVIRAAMEEYHARNVARRTSLRERRPVSVGEPVRPLSSEDDLLDEMLHDSRD